MESCEELEKLLDKAIATLSSDRTEIMLRAFLGALGLEFVHDALQGKKINWTALLDLLITLDIITAISWLTGTFRNTGFNNLAQTIVTRFGGWALLIAVGIITYQIVTAIQKLNQRQQDFVFEIQSYYQHSNCQNKDEIFRKRGLPIP